MATRARRPGEAIEIVEAREHNLRVPHLVLPKDRLIVFTGVSGSGKSSLAFDTLFAEGQRRYIESLSAYARQFLGRLDRPDVERLSGLSPTIAIEQKAGLHNPRSTVGTITEIHDRLRVLFARIGVQTCLHCGEPVRAQTSEEIASALFDDFPGEAILIEAPLIRHRKGEFRELFAELSARGFARIRVDGEVHRLDSPPKLQKTKKHSISLIVDRLRVEEESRARISEDVELGLREGGGELIVTSGERQRLFSESRSCCGVAYPELSPLHFSFNSPLGMCGDCQGLGERREAELSLIVPDPSLSIRQGAIAPWKNAAERGEGWTYRTIEAVAEKLEIDLDRPFEKLPAAARKRVLYGLGDERIRLEWGGGKDGSSGSWAVRFEGVIPSLERRYAETTSERMREHYARYFKVRRCSSCEGKRLAQIPLAVKIEGESIASISSLSIEEASRFFDALRLEERQAEIAEGLLREIRARLRFLMNVGLDYLSLDRSGPSLSGGEAQRIRLASQLGSELSGVIYILDEPSIGLHARDNARLIQTLKRLRDLGNTVIVVEHDEETIREADHLVDFGPGAGSEGGAIVYAGSAKGIEESGDSLTAAYLRGDQSIYEEKARRTPKSWLRILGASENNLKDIDAAIPLGCLVAITGVSGAGKSSLISGTLLPALMHHFYGSHDRIGTHRAIEGLDALDKVIAVDQRPIGRTPRSNPATYTKAFDEIRKIFAALPEARARGYSPGRFSFNVKGGRCEACTGDGVVKVEMHFLNDVYVACEVCRGKRYNEQTLAIRYREKNIADVLELSVDEAAELFAPFPPLVAILNTLQEVGLGYVKLGQPATTLSGGEAQRIKLSRELAKRKTGKTLYILDEPTTGLHFEDIRRLLAVLERLVELGNTVLVVEHQLDLIAAADHLIDLGPLGGHRGGRIIAEGTPEEVAKVRESHTGQALREFFALRRKGKSRRSARMKGSARDDRS
ncbi:MAG: excinuclease ABC subunit UvrA [Sandaracinaceae bacterium]|nr:excinuclease ABC subunit UvrA [Sandaracinaceae bacterium]